MSDESDEKKAEGSDKVTGRAVAPPTILQRPSDQALRPGFRNPANTRSKAQRSAKKKAR